MIPQSWRTRENLLLIMSASIPFAFATWMALLNNFVVERAAFTGAEIGMLQSIREIPGFLAFTAVFILLFLKEQVFALAALLLLGVGVSVTGLFPSVWGLYITTFIMSVGFHYFETIKSSLTLQWLTKKEAPELMGKMLSVSALASLLVYGFLWVGQTWLHLDFKWLYMIGGSICCVLVVFMWACFPRFEAHVEQHKHLVFRRRYWLYYALVFMGGARRQIFVVFAGFMMVEKFHYSVADIALLYLINHVINWLFARKIGAFIGRVGERKALQFEYVGLIFIFAGYALVESSTVAATLYVFDHIFFALAIAMNTYFQKIADPADIASTASVSFTINHIAAVVIPVTFGLLWLISPAAVFWLGAVMAVVSLALAFIVPKNPSKGNEVHLMFSENR